MGMFCFYFAKNLIESPSRFEVYIGYRPTYMAHIAQLKPLGSSNRRFDHLSNQIQITKR